MDPIEIDRGDGMSTIVQTKRLVAVAKSNALEMKEEAMRMRKTIDVQIKTLKQMEQTVKKLKVKPAHVDTVE